MILDHPFIRYNRMWYVLIKIVTSEKQSSLNCTGIRDIDTWSEAMRSPFMALYGEEYFRKQWSNWVDAYQAYYDKRSGECRYKGE